MLNQKTFIILAIVLVIILAGGLFYSYEKARNTSQTYQLNLFAINGSASLDGVIIGLTPNHGQIVEIEILVTPQHTGGSNIFLADFINNVDWTGTFTNSTYTVGQTITMYRIYQDGYAERTKDGILLTEQMLGAAGPRGFGVYGTIPLVFDIPPSQWVTEGA